MRVKSWWGEKEWGRGEKERKRDREKERLREKESKQERKQGRKEEERKRRRRRKRRENWEKPSTQSEEWYKDVEVRMSLVSKSIRKVREAVRGGTEMESEWVLGPKWGWIEIGAKLYFVMKGTAKRSILFYVQWGHWQEASKWKICYVFWTFRVLTTYWQSNAFGTSPYFISSNDTWLIHTK